MHVCPYIATTKSHRNTNIDRTVVHATAIFRSSRKVKRSTVKVTRLLNAVIESQPYFRNWKAYELNFKLGIRMEYNDPHQWHARWPRIDNRTRRPASLTYTVRDLQGESSWWLFTSPLAGGGGILWRPHCMSHSLFYIVVISKILLRFTLGEFLPRDAVRKRGLCCHPVSVSPSVCPSVYHVGAFYPHSWSYCQTPLSAR